MVYTTLQSTSKTYPVNVEIRATDLPSIAKCQQVHTIFKEQLGDRIGACNPYEMEQIHKALAVAFSIPYKSDVKEAESPNDEFAAVIAERNVYRDIVNGLLVKN